MAQIEIDGKKIEAAPGSMIIEAADEVGIWIPRFCYHKKLSIAANCRMCLVDVEKAPKPLPACATPITEGMKIYTRSEKALIAQKAVMEFLLINHPLDCPICDQGGECELQDIALGYGKDHSRYDEPKRVVKDKDIGPLISTDMTRCIHCTRCVRFGSEIAGMRELGATGRGEHMEIGTFIEKNVDSEISGNVIEICPVGALTSKPYRFTARGWELQQSESIAPHDCIGSNIYVHSRRGKVMRVVPRENEALNEVWISDRDRFSYEALEEERLLTPKVKRNNKWVSIDWEEALELIVQECKQTMMQSGEKSIAALASPSLTTEEYYIVQKFIRSLGSPHVDHRLRQQDFRHQEKFPTIPSMGGTIQSLEQRDLVLLIGSDVRNEQPILNVKLRKMALHGKKIAAINPYGIDFNFDLADSIIVPGGNLVSSFAGVAKALLKHNSHSKEISGATEWLKNIESTDEEKALAELMRNAGSISILFGNLAITHPDYSKLFVFANMISHVTSDTVVGTLTEGANAAGAYLAGMIPHRTAGGIEAKESGLTAKEFWEEKSGIKAMFLIEVEPSLDCMEGLKAMQKLRNMDFVVGMSAFESDVLKEVASLLLPMSPFTENGGSFINVEGRLQSFRANVPPQGDSRPLWKIMRVLGNFFQLAGFEYHSLDELQQAMSEEMLIEDTLKQITETNELLPWWSHDEPIKIKSPKALEKMIRIAPVPIYAIDSLVRRAKSLQRTKQAEKIVAKIHPEFGKLLELNSGDFAEFKTLDETVILPVELDEAVAGGTVVIPGGLSITNPLGRGYLPIHVKAVET